MGAHSEVGSQDPKNLELSLMRNRENTRRARFLSSIAQLPRLTGQIGTKESKHRKGDPAVWEGRLEGAARVTLVSPSLEVQAP